MMKVEAALLSNRLKGKAVPPYNQIPVLWTPCGVHVWVCKLQVSGFGEGRAPGTQHQLLAASVQSCPQAGTGTWVFRLQGAAKAPLTLVIRILLFQMGKCRLPPKSQPRISTCAEMVVEDGGGL